MPYLFYPASNRNADAAPESGQKDRAAIPRVAYLFIGGVVCLIINQSMVFSFVERIGVERGFAGERLQIVLVVLGFINLLPGALAAILQNRLSPFAVGIAGLSLQAVLALILTNGLGFPAFAGPVLFFSAIVLFTHTFLFGALSQVDPSGRSAAATPAMMMAGAAIGPVLGGGLVATLSFGGIGWATLALSAIGVTLMFVARGISTTKALALDASQNHR